MRPLIGICTNYSTDEQIGLKEGIGAKSQEWQVIAHDYVYSVEAAGGTPLLLPITKHIESLERALSILDGLIITGGHDVDPQTYGEFPRPGLGPMDPVRDQHEIQLIDKVIKETNIPVLGICRGAQILNVSQGGSLYQDLSLERPSSLNHSPKLAPKYHPTHVVTIKENSKLHAIYGKEAIAVNSFHHQSIKHVGKGFDVTMLAPDGVIEGIEMKGDRFVVGVQWHPEMMVERDSSYLSIFKRFIQVCGGQKN